MVCFYVRWIYLRIIQMHGNWNNPEYFILGSIVYIENLVFFCFRLKMTNSIAIFCNWEHIKEDLLP